MFAKRKFFSVIGYNVVPTHVLIIVCSLWSLSVGTIKIKSVAMEKIHPQESKDMEEASLNEGAGEVKIKIYGKRWVILTIYIIYAAINALQWFEYSVIANIVMRYYDVDSLAVDWTSIIYMALYMPMVIPASYFIDKKVQITILSISYFASYLLKAI